jgi:hypothetical protein
MPNLGQGNLYGAMKAVHNYPAEINPARMLVAFAKLCPPKAGSLTGNWLSNRIFSPTTLS